MSRTLGQRRCDPKELERLRRIEVAAWRLRSKFPYEYRFDKSETDLVTLAMFDVMPYPMPDRVRVELAKEERARI